MLFQKVQEIHLYTRLINTIFSPMFIIGQPRNTLQLKYGAELPITDLLGQSLPFLQLQVCNLVHHCE